jgi:hypothetical protein
MPVMRWRVVCALREVMLIFCPPGVHQRGLAHVGLAHDGDQAAALRRAPGIGRRCRGGLPTGLAAASIASRSWVV